MVRKKTRKRWTNSTKFLNRLIKGGKRESCELLLLKCFIYLKFVSKKSSQNVLCRSVQNTSPNFEVISKRIGGGFYKIPTSTVQKTPRRKIFLGISNIIKCSGLQKEFSLLDRLVLEVLDCSLNRGLGVASCKKMHEEAFLNRAFLSYSFKK
jgi:small subunit ribosomal protein S7